MEAEVRLLVAPAPAAPRTMESDKGLLFGAWHRLVEVGVVVATSPVCCVWETRALPAVCQPLSLSVCRSGSHCLSLRVLHPHRPSPSLSPWHSAGLPLSLSPCPLLSLGLPLHTSLPFSPSLPSGSQPVSGGLSGRQEPLPQPSVAGIRARGGVAELRGRRVRKERRREELER